jgi:hypothetical protein
MNFLEKNHLDIIKNIKLLKSEIKNLNNANTKLEHIMNTHDLNLLNIYLPDLNIKKIHEDEIFIILKSSKQNNQNIKILIQHYIYLLSKHAWCLYFTKNISYDILSKFFLNLLGININNIINDKQQSLIVLFNNFIFFIICKGFFSIFSNNIILYINI